MYYQLLKAIKQISFPQYIFVENINGNFVKQIVLKIVMDRIQLIFQ